jgi:propanol-preferring alcohol dehydrogenase
MKAAVMTGFRVPLEVQQLPDPTPGPHDAVIEVEACGICRSDWHLWQDHFSWVGVTSPLPLVPGHEFGGFVAAVGPAVQLFKPGDRVTVPFHLACGHCTYCLTGRSQLCQAHGFIGVTSHGGYGRLASCRGPTSTWCGCPPAWTISPPRCWAAAS